MNLMELKKSLDEENIQNLYILTGEEYKILETYIDIICRKSSCSKVCSDSVFSIYKKLDSKSLISSQCSIYVVREDKDFLTNESIWKDLVKKLEKRGSVLIAKYNSLDSRSKFYKCFSDNVVVFDRLSESVLIKYIRKDLPELDEDNCKNLIDSCGGIYGKILLELDKIQNVKAYYGLSDNKSFDFCIQNSAFHSNITGQVFDLVKSIMSRNYAKIFQELAKSKQRGDNALAILSLLHSNIKNLLQVQVCEDMTPQEICSITGLSSYQVKIAKGYLNSYSYEETARFMKYVKYCDESVKKGILESDSCIEYLLVNIL